MDRWIGATLLVAGFLALLKLFRLVERGRESLGIVRQSFGQLADRTLDDDAKEKAMRQYSLRLFGLFGTLAFFGAAAALLPLALLWLLDRAGWIDLDAIMATAMSWPFLCASGVVTVVVLWLLSRRSAPQRVEGGFEIRYSATDRLLHQVAFATTPMQTALSRLEDRVYRRRIAAVRAERPAFICALPRAGTTLLLDLCAKQDGMVMHTYRDMPFVHIPMFWERFARSFRSTDVARERAHGDGMLVSVDSPEALEETLWTGFWTEHFLKDRIRPWTGMEKNEEFRSFFEQHMRKLAALRSSHVAAGKVRYVSKNNLNIARVGWLVRNFPDARILIPFREPLQHAASLLRQHLNFLEIHRQDDFARQYMAAIGHFDFGANLRPVDFGGWLGSQPVGSATELDFWLRYWNAAHRHLLNETGNRVQLLSYDAFCADPVSGLERVGNFLEIGDRSSFCGQHSLIRAPKPHVVDRSALDTSILEEAQGLHERLMSRSLV